MLSAEKGIEDEIAEDKSLRDNEVELETDVMEAVSKIPLRDGEEEDKDGEYSESSVEPCSCRKGKNHDEV